MMFIYRLIPFVCSMAIVFAFWLQVRYPFYYPWIALSGAVLLPLASFWMARGRVGYKDLLEKMSPTLIFVLALVFALLLAEGGLQVTAIIILAGVGTYLSLELLFLLAFAPPRYPVHGISRVNIAYVPFIIFYIAATSAGLMTFVHTPLWIHVVLMTVLGLILFRTTGHPEATKEQNQRWMLIGLITGLHLGLLGAMLPLSMFAQGAIAMVLFSSMLRLRRYLYHPLPVKKQAWLEGVTAIVLLSAILTTSRWL
jgi:hypothetical protein